jgi:uncharacterized protein (DUF2147 family)
VTDFQTIDFRLPLRPSKGLTDRWEAGVTPEEEFMIRKLLLSAAFLMTATVASQADAIEGNWKRPTGAIVKFQKCGAAYCAVVQTGEFKGQQAGSMSGKDGTYRGSLTDLKEKKTYKGKAKIKGGSMAMSGCVLGGLICKTEAWVKQ